jgi:hypothetical protein
MSVGDTWPPVLVTLMQQCWLAVPASRPSFASACITLDGGSGSDGQDDGYLNIATANEAQDESDYMMPDAGNDGSNPVSAVDADEYEAAPAVAAVPSVLLVENDSGGIAL